MVLDISEPVSHLKVDEGGHSVERAKRGRPPLLASESQVVAVARRYSYTAFRVLYRLMTAPTTSFEQKREIANDIIGWALRMNKKASPVDAPKTLTDAQLLAAIEVIKSSTASKV
jgi:hypothetical protein